jgi:signal transduction histidine kinase
MPLPRKQPKRDKLPGAAQRADLAKLRRDAEARLADQSSKRPRERSHADSQRMLHELDVHQIELQMQNAELHQARDQAEGALERLTDLYDFAPIGYFSLNEQGVVLEANLRGAAMLGVDRSKLINRRLQPFIPAADRAAFSAFLQSVFAGVEAQIWEGAFTQSEGLVFRADFKAAQAASLKDNGKWCRIAVLVLSDAAQRRMDVLAQTIQDLNHEIARREQVEEALQKSERHQAALLEQSRAMQEHLRQLSHQILHVQEAERKRISRELHDEIAQTLVGINIQLEALTYEISADPRRLKQKIAQTQKIVQHSVRTVHQFARELRPVVLDDLGLVPALKTFMDAFSRRLGIRTRLTAAAGVDAQLDNARSTVLYRVAQEALTNVSRHAHATAVEVRIRKLPGSVRLQINDNGKGFEVEKTLKAGQNKRLGLLGMRERLEMVGGSLKISSSPGRGTTLDMEIPHAPSGARILS